MGSSEEGHTGKGNRKRKSPKMEMSLGGDVTEVDRTKPCRASLGFLYPRLRNEFELRNHDEKP